MGRQRFTPEFKDEAVRQVIERGHPVAEVAVRLGVTDPAELTVTQSFDHGCNRSEHPVLSESDPPRPRND